MPPEQLRGSFRLLLNLFFHVLFLFCSVLLSTLFLIPLALVSHYIPPLPVIPHILIMKEPY